MCTLAPLLRLESPSQGDVVRRVRRWMVVVGGGHVQRRKLTVPPARRRAKIQRSSNFRNLIPGVDVSLKVYFFWNAHAPLPTQATAGTPFSLKQHTPGLITPTPSPAPPTLARYPALAVRPAREAVFSISC